jgi:hypothetical protein
MLHNMDMSSGVPRGGCGVKTPLPQKFRSIDKTEPNSQFRGIHTHKNIVRIQVSFL